MGGGGAGEAPVIMGGGGAGEAPIIMGGGGAGEAPVIMGGEGTYPTWLAQNELVLDNSDCD